jgi:hypothetical protein
MPDDLRSLNIMMDARGMYPEGWHFTHLDYTEDFKPLNSIFTRTERPPKYYWIDFGVSATYDRSKPTVDAICGGGDKNPPEHQNRATMKTADPFPTDIFYLGNLFQEHFLDVGQHCHPSSPCSSDSCSQPSPSMVSIP